jgi:glucose-6-phosphate 1-epimerase
MILSYGEMRAVVSLHGATLTSFIPSPAIGEVIWTGGHEPAPGDDCWGGIPLVWPWFMSGTGESPKGPFHGVARFAKWEVLDISKNSSFTELRLKLPGLLESASGEPVQLEAELRVRLSDTLTLELITTNPTDRSQPLEHCFHSYFFVGDVTRIRINGLEDSEVQDNLLPTGSPRSKQAGTVTLQGPAARIFRPFPDEVSVEDPVLNRRIRLRSPEAAQLVLWNSGTPRIENNRPTGEVEWQTQIALEPLRGLEQILTLAPGEKARLSLEIEVEPLTPSKKQQP